MSKNTFSSPGVFTREFDLSYIPQDIPDVGAAFIGPTARGPAMVPTTISSYSEYLSLFGNTITSGSNATKQEYKYLTNQAVEGYLKYANVATVLRVLGDNFSAAFSNVGSLSGLPAFKIVALTDGEITNSGRVLASTNGSGSSSDIYGSTNQLYSGSSNNMRWEVANVDTDRGTFDLYIRRGDDSENKKIFLETYSQLSLDPGTSNFITKVIGDQVHTLRYDSNGSPYLEKSGSYANRSAFIRVENVRNTLNYIDADTITRNVYTGSLPLPVSGTFAGGSDGNVAHPIAFNDKIWNLNTQGFKLDSASYGKTAYEDAINILSNKDQYDINMLFTPGLIDGLDDHAKIITKAINMCEERGDLFYVVDPTYKGSTVGQARGVAEGRNTNYAAMYYPWCQISDPDLGRNLWVPPSTVVSSVFAFNDYVQHPWYAPAGLNRGGLDAVLQTERLMTQNDRDNLYNKNINPIASFPRQGNAVWGQKTLQKKRSALDRINVRRLMIDAKRFVAYTVKYLVFENNTIETRAKFIELVDPYFRRVKNQQGLYDYRIIIDERNNTPDVVDRNEMRAQIYLKPAKTAEFIIVDFVVLPTGALFPVDAAE